MMYVLTLHIKMESTDSWLATPLATSLTKDTLKQYVENKYQHTKWENDEHCVSDKKRFTIQTVRNLDKLAAGTSS